MSLTLKEVAAASLERALLWRNGGSLDTCDDCGGSGRAEECDERLVAREDGR